MIGMENATGLTAQHKAQELKKKLLDCLDSEKKNFTEIVESFFAKEKPSEADKQVLLKAIVDAVNHVLASGDWESSLFLRNVVKPLKEIKAEAESELSRHSDKAFDTYKPSAPLSPDEVEVAVSLFQSDGYNMDKWAVQLRSLDRYVLGRPVYENEADVQKRIRLRASTANEAYVIVAIAKADILMGQSQQDPHGHTLLLLKESAVKNGRILFFVHEGIRYRFVDGRLIK